MLALAYASGSFGYVKPLPRTSRHGFVCINRALKYVFLSLIHVFLPLIHVFHSLNQVISSLIYVFLSINRLILPLNHPIYRKN